MSNKSVSARFFEIYGNQHDVEGWVQPAWPHWSTPA